MLTIKSRVGQSSIHGVGLFADQFIPKGTITWRFDPRFDIHFDTSEVEKMPAPQKDLILFYAVLSKKTGRYVYSIDNSRFINHSVDPNTADCSEMCPDDTEVCSVATRDIEIGEEITIDYRLIDSADENGDSEYLKT